MPSIEESSENHGKVKIHPRPQTSHCLNHHEYVNEKLDRSTRAIKYVEDHSETSTVAHELGSVPEYVKKYKSRVSFEKFPQTSTTLLKQEISRARRPQTPKFISRLEAIPEEPEVIGDGEQDEASMKKFQSEFANLKQFVKSSIDSLKTNCEESEKSLFENLESLNMRITRHKKEYELANREKSQEIQNWKKKNEALNTSLKHKTDENFKLKRELNELKSKLNFPASFIKTESMRTLNLK